MRRVLVFTLVVACVAALLSVAAPTATTIRPTSGLRAVGSPVLSDAEAASRIRSSAWEPRAADMIANTTVPTAAQLATFTTFIGQWGSCDNLRAKVTGNFKGTTDEMIQWAAWKWGLPENVARAVAVNESWWRMSTVGDNDESFGLMQVRNRAEWHGGTFPLSKDSTAFNVDYWAGMIRQYFDGCSDWMDDYSDNGTTYRAGDLWGSIGAWYAGRWHSDGANRYIAQVKKHRLAKTWLKPGF